MDNPFNKEREGIQNRLHNLFEEFKSLDDSEKLLHIYSEILQVNYSSNIESDQIAQHYEEMDDIDWDALAEEDQSANTLSLKELSFVIYQTGIVDHLIAKGLTKEETALLLRMITGFSFNSLRQHLSKNWDTLTNASLQHTIKDIHRQLWRKAEGHEKTQSLIHKIDPVASNFIKSKGVTDNSSPENTDV